VPDKPLKAIRLVLDSEPLAGPKEIKLALWMSRRYFCTVYEAIKTILPAAVWFQHKKLWTLCAPGADMSEREAAVCDFLVAFRGSSRSWRRGSVRE